MVDLGSRKTVVGDPQALIANDARPVDAGERVVLLDVVRGFALGGVFLSNVHLWFSGLLFLPVEQVRASMSQPVNAIVGHSLRFLVAGKFFTIFSFLFGLGFSVQLMRADTRGASVVPLYARRLAILVLIGAAHLFALWYGDILHTYALLGVFLLAFRRRSDQALLIWGLLLAILVPTAATLATRFLPHLWSSPETLAAAEEASIARSADFNATMLATFSSSSYGAIVRSNPAAYWEMFVDIPTLGFHVGLIGRFLLGFYAGRRKLFHDVPAHRRFFRRTLGWGLLAGLLGSVIAGATGHLMFTGERPTPKLLPRLVGLLTGEISLLGLAAFYIAAIALLFQRERWRRVLTVLAPVGQMALSNYLAESVLGIAVFYGIGLGLIGKVERLTCVGMVFGLFILQIVWSHLWLARFQFGPVEWVWRSLTYGKMQPMRRGDAGPSGSPAL